MEKYQGKYRIPPARAQWWDYSWDAAYFITICTKDRECFFGAIHDDNVLLSEIGIIANSYWTEIPNHAGNAELGPHIIMPNHVHGILNLTGNPRAPVETRHALSLRPIGTGKTIGQLRFQNPGKKTISTIIGGYKSAVSSDAHKLCAGFEWQPRFHDHIIRNQEEYDRIAAYILTNPANGRMINSTKNNCRLNISDMTTPELPFDKLSLPS